MTIISTIFCINKLIVGEYVLGLAPKGTHEWDLYINPEDIEKIIGPHGFQTVEKKGAGVTNLLTFEMDETNDLDVNYLMLSKKV